MKLNFSKSQREVIPDVPGDLSRIVLQQLTILLPYCDKELINGHGRVYSDLPPKQRVDFVFLVDGRELRPRRTRARARKLEYLNGRGCMFGDETCKPFDAHFVVVAVLVSRMGRDST